MRPDTLRELFNKMDRDGSGYIDAKDYRRVLRGYATNQDIRARILNMDDDLDGQVSFEEFSKAMNTAVVEEPSDLPSPSFRNEDGSWNWFAIFSHFDEDGSGALSLRELRTFVEGEDFGVSKKFWISLVEGMDRNADMSISYHEFMSYLSGRKKRRRLYRRV